MVDFSVIIPVYQAERYLKRFLESLQNQSYPHFEVIMIDDGSKDSSYHICLEFQKRDKRFFAFHQENKGASVARNKGLEIAKKKYVLFVDADDYVSPDYLYSLNQAIGLKTDVCINTKYYEIRNDKVKIVAVRSYQNCYNWRTREKFIEGFSNYKEELPIGSMSNCYRREFLSNNKIYFDTKYTNGEDIDFACKVFLSFSVCAWLEAPYYYYNKDNEDSASHIKEFQKVENILLVYKKWFYYFRKQKIFQKQAELFSEAGNGLLLYGIMISRLERKKFFDREKENLDFYKGNLSKLKKFILMLYLIFGYENIVPFIALVHKLQTRL